MWATKLLISSVKKRIFCPKTTKFGPKLAFLVNFGQAMQAFSVHCWWVGWWLWRAGCILQDTYLLYIYIIIIIVPTAWSASSISHGPSRYIILLERTSLVLVQDNSPGEQHVRLYTGSRRKQQQVYFYVIAHQVQDNFQREQQFWLYTKSRIAVEDSRLVPHF